MGIEQTRKIVSRLLGVVFCSVGVLSAQEEPIIARGEIEAGSGHGDAGAYEKGLDQGLENGAAAGSGIYIDPNGGYEGNFGSQPLPQNGPYPNSELYYIPPPQNYGYPATEQGSAPQQPNYGNPAPQEISVAESDDELVARGERMDREENFDRARSPFNENGEYGGYGEYGRGAAYERGLNNGMNEGEAASGGVYVGPEGGYNWNYGNPNLPPQYVYPAPQQYVYPAPQPQPNSAPAQAQGH